MAPGPERVDGTIVSWNDSRGFGFIAPGSGGRDAFVHISDVAWGLRRPRVGQRVTFEPAAGPGGKPQAKAVLPEGRTLSDSTRFGRMPVEHRNLGYLAVAVFTILFVVVVIDAGLPIWVVALYIGSSIASVVVYAADKSAAVSGRWRISESTLLVVGVIGGWPGGVIAQRVLHHKTRKRSFQWAFWGTASLNVVAFLVFAAAFAAYR